MTDPSPSAAMPAGERRFAEAVRAFLAFKSSGRRDVDAWLAEHADLRELLEPMLRPEPPPHERTFGDYVVRRELGRGGMGVVYEAVQRSLGRVVALKVLPAGLVQPSAVARLQREARLVARLAHPGIVQVFDAGIVDGTAFYAMEWIDGRTLEQALAALRGVGLAGLAGIDAHTRVFGAGSDGPPRGHVEVALAIAIHVADALAHAHEAGIVHRDVKPANLLLRADGRVFLSDFGIARALDPGASLTAESAGTPHYMAPEQANGGDVDGRADVFSLGAVLYELLTLQRPFPGDTALAVLDHVRRAATPDPRARNAQVDADLAATVMKALAVVPGERYATMAAFAADLRACRDGGDVAARPPSRAQQLRRWARREPWRAAAAGIAAIALLGGALLGLWFTRTLLDETTRTQKALADVNRLSLGVRLDAAAAVAAPFVGAGLRAQDAMRAWLQREGEPLFAELPALQAQLAGLRARALPYDAAAAARDRATHPDADDLQRLAHELAQKASGTTLFDEMIRNSDAAVLQARRDELAARIAQRRTWTFARAEDQYLHDETARLVERLAAFAAPRGALGAVRIELEWAATCAALQREHGEAAWREARAAVAADARYGGLALAVDPELLPIGADPDSGLQEFVHLRSAAPPYVPRREHGHLVVDGALGIVLVLLPPGRATVGALEGMTPGHVVRFDACWLGKYEVTQAQWLRLTGDNPSRLRPGARGLYEVTDSHPVEFLSVEQASQGLQRFGLQLPSEAQWEYGCRAGTTTPWFFGERDRAPEFVNFADADAAAVGVPFACDTDLHDGALIHRAVGSYRPNAFGLHDMLGNVMELCPGPSLVAGTPRDGDGRCDGLYSNRDFGVGRGGHCQLLLQHCSASVHRPLNVRSLIAMGGCRACRAVGASH